MKAIRTIEEFPLNAPIYLFGAGEGGQMLFNATRALANVQIRGFLDNNKRVDEVLGVPVLDARSFLANHEPEAVVVIASQYYRDIALQLRASKFPNVYNAYPWIETMLKRRAMLKRRMIAAGVGLAAVLAVAALTAF